MEAACVRPPPVPMPIQLYQPSGDELLRLRDGSRELRGLSVLDGALPPDLVLDTALHALSEGRPAFWHAPFLYIATHPAGIIGAGGFKGEPVDGCVEIGYGVAQERRGRGIATMAAVELVRIALAQPGVRTVLAETAVINLPSRRVVEKAGFRWFGQRDTESDGLVDLWRIDAL
jgi:[ribosomal protein S5]-alanine N-acetyltransferase